MCRLPHHGHVHTEFDILVRMNLSILRMNIIVELCIATCMEYNIKLFNP